VDDSTLTGLKINNFMITVHTGKSEAASEGRKGWSTVPNIQILNLQINVFHQYWMSTFIFIAMKCH